MKSKSLKKGDLIKAICPNELVEIDYKTSVFLINNKIFIYLNYYGNCYKVFMKNKIWFLPKNMVIEKI